MTITINGSGTITGATTMASATSFSSTVSAAGNVTLAGSGVKLLNNSGNPVVQQAGSILQVVQTVKTDSFATSATVSDTAVTGLTASITPTSSTSKILVMIELAISSENAQGGAAKVTRGGSVISAALPTSYGSRSPSTFSGSAYRGSASNYPQIAWGLSMNYLDSPATTSSITYGVVVSSISVGTYVNRTGIDTDAADSSRAVSSITLMEVAA